MNKRLLLLVVCLLMGSYLLVYVNAPSDADGMAMLAVATNLVRNGSTDMNVIGANDWLLLPKGKMGTFGVDGALYAKKGVTPSLLMLPLVYIADKLPFLSIRATTALFNAFVTAATALLLCIFVYWLGFRQRTAFAIGLIYGLATFAITYVKTLFGEPLVALLLLAAVMAGWRWRQNQRDGRMLWIIGLSLALSIGVNLAYVLFVPVLGLYLLSAVRPFTLAAIWSRRAYVAFILVPLLALGVIVAAVNIAHFGNALTSGYQFAAGEGFTYPLVDGLYGLWLSPYRGLFWYNPLLLLAIPGWWWFRRQFSALTWLCLALVATQALLFASWWSWYGGIVWGPRFLLPAVPLLMLFVASVVERGWSRRWLFVGIGVLVGLSALIQLLGVLFSYLPYTGYLIAAFAEPIPKWVIASPLLSPIVGHLALWWGGYAFDPAWLARGVDGVQLIACLALIGVGAMVASRPSSQRVEALKIGSVAVAILIACGIVVARQQDDPSVQRSHELEQALQPPALTVAATTLLGDSLLDFKSDVPVISMNAPTAPDDERARMVWTYAKEQSSRLWLVTWFPPAAAENWQERDLWENASFIREASAANHRAVLFDLSPAPDADQAGGWAFGGTLHLDSYGTRMAEDAIYVTLTWSAGQPTDVPYTWFVHLIDPAGNIIAQQDRQPLGGYAPTTTWQAAQPITDRLAFLVPRDLDKTTLRLRIGVVRTGNSAPEAVVEAGGNTLADPFVIVAVR